MLQHQGLAGEIAAPAETEAATDADLPAIATLDRLAFGGDREELLSYFTGIGEFAVIRRDGGISGFACLRPFGRGEVIGPVVAADLGEARNSSNISSPDGPGGSSGSTPRPRPAFPRGSPNAGSPMSAAESR